MAVVKEIVMECGRVRIYDDAYRDASPEELERRREKIRQVAGRMLAKLPRTGET